MKEPKRMKRNNLEKLFIEHRDDLYDYLLLHTKNYDLAQDLLQDIFLKLSETENPEKSIDNPASYLFIIARNMVIDYWRKAAVSERIQKEFWKNMQEDRHVLDYPALQYDKKILFNEIIPLLTDQQKTIFLLNRDEGFTYNEIAEQLNLSKSTVKNHMVAALKKIRSHLVKNKLYLVFILVFLEWISDQC